MKLLLDASISWRLAARLKHHFTDCQHVDLIGLSLPPSDIDIWNFALTNNFTIVSNDEDFLNLMNIKGFPPKVILLKTGNQKTSFIEEVLIKHIDDIKNIIESPEYGLLEIY